MSKIVIDAREYSTTTGRYISRLLQYLEKIDAAHDYSILLKPKDMEAARFTNPRFTKVMCPHKEFTFGEQTGLLRQLQGLQADLVHFGKTEQPILYTGKTVTTIHDLTTARFRNPSKNPLVFTVKQAVYKGVIHRVARKSTAIITPSDFVKRDVMQYTGVPKDKISVTHEAADTINEPAEPLPALKGQQFIMYIGRPTPHKNLERLIQAFAQIRKTHPGLKLVLAGRKDVLYERHEAEARRQGITNIFFTGYISEGQLRWLYENCSAYVFPSLSEGFGLPGLEAMQHGAPVVSSKATCLPEIYGSAAHYFDPVDVSDMAKRISEVLNKPSLQARLIQKGKARAAKYSWQRMAEQTLEIYNRTLYDNRS